MRKDLPEFRYRSITITEKEYVEQSLAEAEAGTSLPIEWYHEVIRELLTKVEVFGYDLYNPDFGDDEICACGHPYHRHFDSYEQMAPVGCKYCQCDHFIKAAITPQQVFGRYECCLELLKDHQHTSEELEFIELVEKAAGYSDNADWFRRRVLINKRIGNVLQTAYQWDHLCSGALGKGIVRLIKEGKV